MYFTQFIRNLDLIEISNPSIINKMHDVRRISFTQLNFILNNDFYFRSFNRIIIKKRFLSELLLKFDKEPKRRNIYLYRYNLLTALSTREKIELLMEGMKKFIKFKRYYENKGYHLKTIDIMSLEYCKSFKNINHNISSIDFNENMYSWINFVCPAMVMDIRKPNNSCPP